MNNVKLLHIKCCFFQFFNSPVALKNKKKIWPPKKKLKWRPLSVRWQLAVFGSYSSGLVKNVIVDIDANYVFYTYIRMQLMGNRKGIRYNEILLQ